MATQSTWGFGSLGSSPGMLSTLKNPMNTANTTPMTLNKPQTPTYPAHPSPTAPVSKQITKTANGDTHTTVYTQPKAGVIDKTAQPQTTKPTTQTSQPAQPVTEQVAKPVTPPVTPPPDYRTYPGMISGVVSAAQGNQSIGDRAQEIATNTGADIANIGRLGNAARGGYLTTGTTPVAEGNAAVIAQTTAAQQAAAAAGGQMALQGTQQGLTAQGQKQQGMLGAASLTPEAMRYGGELTPDVQAQNFANKVLSGEMTYEQAKNSMAYAGNVGTTFLNNAITKAGGSPLTLEATGAASQANIQTGGTVGTKIAAAGAEDSTRSYVQASTAFDTAQRQANNLKDAMNTTGVNSNPQLLNRAINQLQNQLGSANYTKFITSLAETQQAYTSLLSSVGAATPTINGEQATLIFNPESTPAQINAAIEALDLAAYAKLKPMYDQMNTYSKNLSGKNNSTGGDISWDSLLL